MALCACGIEEEAELEAESAAILARAPIGASFESLPATMQALGYTCTPGTERFVDRKGKMREAESHFSCEREQNRWLFCTRRTRAILLQLNGRLSNVLVNVGVFC